MTIPMITLADADVHTYSKMCYHKLYIFTTCGHSTYSTHPLRLCRHASIAPTSTYSQNCRLHAHPFQSLRIEALCASCQAARDSLLTVLESRSIVRFDEWKWKVSYEAPAKDLLTSPKTVSFEVTTPTTPSKGGQGGRWSLKRRSQKNNNMK